MDERSLRVLPEQTTFFNKISTTLNRLMLPTKLGFNSWIISIKRNNAVKAFENLEKNEDPTKGEALSKKAEETYALYLESIDKYIMDTIYKKVKNDAANPFETDALSRYYMVVHLKESEYIEYKYQKQKFLLELDYENLKSSEKTRGLTRYQTFYIKKIDGLYKGILKNYSVKLADRTNELNKDYVSIYKNIFSTLEAYIRDVLPIKFEVEGKEKYTKIISEYELYEQFIVGKLDEKEFLEKNMILLGLSRVLFTHSLPLVAAEQCYHKLLRDTRNLIIKTKNDEKREEAYQMLLKLIEDYNIKLLSTKVYWEKPEEREKYKRFWAEYAKADTSEEKEILSLKRDLYDLRKSSSAYDSLRQFYKSKLVEYGQMRTITNYSTLFKNCKFWRELV